MDNLPYPRRTVDLVRYRDTADLIVLHDSNNPLLGLTSSVSNTFPFRYTIKKFDTWTTLLGEPFIRKFKRQRSCQQRNRNKLFSKLEILPKNTKRCPLAPLTKSGSCSANKTTMLSDKRLFMFAFLRLPDSERLSEHHTVLSARKERRVNAHTSLKICASF